MMCMSSGRNEFDKSPKPPTATPIYRPYKNRELFSVPWSAQKWPFCKSGGAGRFWTQSKGLVGTHTTLVKRVFNYCHPYVKSAKKCQIIMYELYFLKLLTTYVIRRFRVWARPSQFCCFEKFNVKSLECVILNPKDPGYVTLNMLL